MGQQGCVRRLAWLLTVIIALAAAPTRAVVDATGVWLIAIPELQTSYYATWVQNGSVLTADGYPGTIDPNTGAFYFSYPSQFPFCVGGSFGGTVAPDGLTLTGYVTPGGTTPTLCFSGGPQFAVVGARQTGSCGDDSVGPTEECDDGNATPGDGCDASCHVETCWTCTGEPSVCAPSAAGSSCDDGIFCTAEACDGAGGCAVTNPDQCVAG